MNKSGTAKSNYVKSTWAKVMKITSQNYEEMDEHMLIASGGTAAA